MIKKILITISILFFSLVLFFITAGIFSSSTYSGSVERIYNAPIDTIWKIVTKRDLQKNWRKDIVKQNNKNNGWVEYISEKDSIEYKIIKEVPNTQFVFSSRSKKFELIAAFNIRLIKIDANKTKVIIYESSKNYNRYASIYFLLTSKEMDILIEHQNITDGLQWLSQFNNNKNL